MGKVLRTVLRIGLQVVATVVGSIIGGPIGAILANIAVAYVSKAIGLTPKVGPPGARGATPTVYRQTITDSNIVYGKRRVGGLLCFFHAKQVGKAHYRYFVVAVAGHRVQGVTKWFLNDEEVTVNAGTGAVTSGVYAGQAWLWFDRGDATSTANATFVSETDGKWTSNHRGRGIAKFYAKFHMTNDIVEAGMPNMTVEIEGKDDILDYRDDSEGYTNNAALVFYDWLKMPREEGGFGAYDDEIPDDDWIAAQANVCDEDVALAAGGTEKRYALDGVIVTGADPSAVRDALWTNCAGAYATVGGKFLMRPGYWVPPTQELSEDDLAGPITVNRFTPGNDVATEVQGTYIDATKLYQPAPFGTQRRESGDIRQMDLDLAFITSKARAERIARIMLRRAEREMTVAWPMNIAGLAVQAMDTVTLDSARYGLSNYSWTVTAWKPSADFGVALGLREEDPEIYEWSASDESTTPTAPAAISTVDPTAINENLSTLVSLSYATGLTVTGQDVGATASIVISSFTRVYTDKQVSVTGATLTGKAFATTYYIYYDDYARAGGAVTFAATTTQADSITSADNPDRHFVATITTPADGAGNTTGYGPVPPGYNGGWYF